MRIVFMGTPAFACPTLKDLHRSRHEIVGVVTGLDKPSGRGRKITPTEIAMTAQYLGYETVKPVSLRDEALFQALKSWQPDLILVIAFRILPRRLFKLPRFGSINVHASLLPKYRGAAPINWALINGEAQTGLTSFFLEKKVDTGDIILQETVTIDDGENFDSLYARLAVLAGPFTLKTLDLVERGGFKAATQDDTMATGAPKIGPFDAMIDFGFPARKVTNFVRGLSTRPGAYTYFRRKKLKILSCRPADQKGQPGLRPGTVIHTKKILLVQCADSAIELTSVIPEGKKPMDAGSFINGFKPQPGEVFGETSAGGN
jgi:methionyl-tRNA formyltransferase